MANQLWGYYDTQGNCWIGDDTGPKTVNDYMLARIGAQLTGVQLGYEPGRIEAREYEAGPKRLRDQVDAKRSPLEALKGIESGD